jgi:hypothetical protein
MVASTAPVILQKQRLFTVERLLVITTVEEAAFIRKRPDAVLAVMFPPAVDMFDPSVRLLNDAAEPAGVPGELRFMGPQNKKPRSFLTGAWN